MSRRRGGPSFGLLLLAGQVMQIGTGNIPPVTLATVIFNVLVYMRLMPYIPAIEKACTSNSLVLTQKQWPRLLYSSFSHLDDMHLYFNMASFISKGIILERQLKSRKFLALIAVFSVLTQVVMLGINQIFYELFSNNYYLYSCAAGFSAVCFALKVVTTSSSDSSSSVMGLPIVIPTRYACWVELILIQILVPNASFTGHLAGILVGLSYTHGPLSKIINFTDRITLDSSQSRRSYRYQQGQTGSASSHHQASNSMDNEDEELQEAIRESLRESSYRSQATERRQSPPSYGWNISNENQPRSRHNLYPDLSQDSQDLAAPSAPPLPSNGEFSEGRFTCQSDFYERNHSESPPYPTTPPYPTMAPYPTDDYVSARPTLHGRNSEPLERQVNTDTIRAARLRKFNPVNKN